MRRPMERVAAPLRLMGARHRDAGRPPAGAGPRRARAARRSTTHCPVASAQVKSAILLAALRAQRLHARHRACALARSHRAHAAQLRRRGWSDERCHDCPRGRPDAARPRRWTCRRISPRRRSSWSPACLAAQEPAAHPQRRHQPDAHRAARDAAGSWALTSACMPHRGAGGRAGRRSRGARERRCAASRCPRRWCRCRSMSSRCSSSRPPARAGRPWCAGRRNCASRRAIGSRPWPRGSRHSASNTGCCRMACGCAAPEASAAAPSTATATIASRWPSRSRRCGPASRSRSSTSPMSRPPSRVSWTLARAAGLQIRARLTEASHR